MFSGVCVCVCVGVCVCVCVGVCVCGWVAGRGRCFGMRQYIPPKLTEPV